MSRMWSKTGISALAGLLAFVATFLVLFVPAKGEPAVSLVNWQSPLGIAVMVLVALAVAFYIISIRKREPGRRDMNAIVKQRQEYLPQLGKTVDQILSRKRELAIQAGKLPLEKYYDKFLAHGKIFDRQYRKLAKTHKDELTRRKVAIAMALYLESFWKKNTYFLELQEGDTSILKPLLEEYKAHKAHNTDRILSGNLRCLFGVTQLCYSVIAFAELGKSNNLPFKSAKYLNKFYEKPKLIETQLEKLHQAVSRRIDELRRGDDFE